MVKPRIRSLPAALGSRGQELVELAERLGYTLDPWQKLAVNDVLATNDAGALAAFETVLIVARQCGKSLVGELYALHWALQGQAVMFTTQRADTARLLFLRLLATLPEELEARPTFTNGALQIAFPGGGVIWFRTRGPRVGRGFTIDKLLVDECQICDPEHLDAMVPGLRTRPDAQILYLGCAPDARSNATCDVLYELRERAKRGDSERLCYLEWSSAFFDGEGAELQANELTEAMLDDEREWERATPAMESGRITLDGMRAHREHYTEDPVGFAVEYLTVAIWPVGGAAAGPLSLEAWHELVDPESAVWEAGESIAELVVAFDVSPARKVSVVVVGYREDERLHADFVGCYEGASAAVRAIASIYNRPDGDVRYIACDGTPENLDLLARLRQEYVSEEALCFENASRVGPTACSALIDLVNEGRFRHRGQLELTEAVRGAVVRPFSDSWLYSRSRSRTDVSPLIACAVGLWKADVEFQPGGADIAIR